MPGHADPRRIPSAAVGAATGPRRGHAPEGARGTAGTGAQRSVPAVPTPVSLFQGKAAGKESAEPGAAAGPVVAAGDGGVRVSVRAKPGSRCSAVTGGRRAGRAQRGRAGAVLCGTAAVLRSAWGRAALSRFRSYDEGGPFSFACR